MLQCRLGWTSSSSLFPLRSHPVNKLIYMRCLSHRILMTPSNPMTPPSSLPLRHAMKTDESIKQLGWKKAPDFSLKVYQDLSKARLAALVLLTSMSGYAMAPGATQVTSLLWTTLGTGLCVSSANIINQWIEAPYDAQMARTRNRALVRRAISPYHAFLVGITSGAVGVALLYSFVNPLTAALGAANIVLYTCVYTPMKRTSIANTWVGSVVGSIPPVMGWTACTGSIDAGALILGGILFAWQFPHFNALSWKLRPDYSKAGYRMMSVTHPQLNARVALRYTCLLFPLTLAAPVLNMTTWWFLLDASILNSVLLYGAIRFWRNSNDQTARELFFASLVHLPIILALLMLHKLDVDL